MTVTLKTIEARQKDLAEMIETLKKSINPSCIEIGAATIDLQPGERYAGSLLDAHGTHAGHLVLMAQRPVGKLNWQSAMDWAKSIGGELPTRQEQSLLFANCKPHLDASWHWSCETHTDDASCAWYCYFGHGDVSSGHKSFDGSAVAVRRL